MTTLLVHIKDKKDFDEQVKNAGCKLVVVDFFATWCGPCKIIEPQLQELSERYGDKVIVLKVDVDECEDLVNEFDVSSMPTFVFLKKGEKSDRFAGANIENLEKCFSKFLD